MTKSKQSQEKNKSNSSGLPIASLILLCLMLVVFFMPVIFIDFASEFPTFLLVSVLIGIVALVVSSISLNKIKKKNLSGRNLSLISLIVSAVFLLFFLVLLEIFFLRVY